jgi:hypothetical protein
VKERASLDHKCGLLDGTWLYHGWIFIGSYLGCGLRTVCVFGADCRSILARSLGEPMLLLVTWPGQQGVLLVTSQIAIAAQPSSHRPVSLIQFLFLQHIRKRRLETGNQLFSKAELVCALGDSALGHA